MTDSIFAPLDFASLCIIPSVGQHDRYEGFVVRVDGKPGNTPIAKLGERAVMEARTMAEACDLRFPKEADTLNLSFEGRTYKVSRTRLYDSRQVYLLSPLPKGRPNLLSEMRNPKLATHLSESAAHPGIYIVSSNQQVTRERYGAAFYLAMLSTHQGLGVAADRTPHFDLSGDVDENCFSAHIDADDKQSLRSAIRGTPSALFVSSPETKEEAELLLQAASNDIPCVVTIQAADIAAAIKSIGHLIAREPDGSDDQVMAQRFSHLLTGAIHVKVPEEDGSGEKRNPIRVILDAVHSSDDLENLRAAVKGLDTDTITNIASHQTKFLANSLRPANS